MVMSESGRWTRMYSKVLHLCILITATAAQTENRETDPQGHVLRDWLNLNGAFVHPGFIITDTTQTTSVRGISCIEPIESGTTLIRVPGPLAFSDAQAKFMYGKGLKFVTQETSEENSRMTNEHWAIAIGLAAERLKGKDSLFWPYIQSLPAECLSLWCQRDINALRNIPYTVGFIDPLPSSAETWARLVEFSRNITERAKSIETLLKTVDFAELYNQVGKKARHWSFWRIWKQRERRKPPADAELLRKLTTDDILWGLGMASSRCWRTMNSLEDAEYLSLPYLLMVPYADMPNHSRESRDKITLSDTEGHSGEYAEHFDNLGPFSILLKASRSYAPGEEILITYKGDSRTIDTSWLVEYGVVFPNNPDSEFAMIVRMSVIKYPRMKDILIAYQQAAIKPRLNIDGSGIFEVTVLLTNDRAPPPWFWGLSRCIVLASGLSTLPADYDKEKRENLESDFRKMLQPQAMRGEKRMPMSPYEVKSIQNIHSWIIELLEHESKGLVNFQDILTDSKEHLSSGRVLEANYLSLHYNGLKVIQNNIRMIERIAEEMTNAGADFDLAHAIMELGFGGEEWTRAFESQNLQDQGKEPNSTSESYQPSHSEGEL